jgi:outer membrane protein OmpA-like peptidoglycan-associated protein
VIAVLPVATSTELAFGADRITVRGTVRDATQLERFTAALDQAVGGRVPVEMDMRVTGKPAPTFKASIVDGNVELEGRLPDHATVESIETAARKAFESVDSRLEVDSNVDRPLIVFRLPLLFTDFAGAHQWSVKTTGSDLNGSIGSAGGFGFDQSVIGPAAASVLDGTARLMLSDLSLTAVVEGHTDSVGTNEYNLALSERRAAAGATYLLDQGVPAPRIGTDGYGESLPVASNETASGRALNRRLIIQVRSS